jgi:hypothetical protein
MRFEFLNGSRVYTIYLSSFYSKWRLPKTDAPTTIIHHLSISANKDHKKREVLLAKKSNLLLVLHSIETCFLLNMGKFRGKRRQNKNKDQPNDQGKRNGENRNDGESYVATIIDQGNYKMEAYYAAQGLHSTKWTDTLTPCSNWDEFETERLLWRSAATQILPASFRFAKDIPSTLREKCEKEMNDLLQVVGKELTVEVVRPLQFLPHAYQLGVDRSMIRKDPNLKAFFEWVKLQNLAGFITRQETVSMVPPVVLQTQPGDCVLDMCAAPGSKTSQILERLGVDGSLIANDNNAKRAQ